MQDQPSYKGFPSHVYDHGVAQERERIHKLQQERSRDERVQRWICAKLAGMAFGSVDEIVRAVVHVVETTEGSEMHPEDERRAVIRGAATALFYGFVDPLEYAGKLLVTRGQGVRFLAPKAA